MYIKRLSLGTTLVNDNTLRYLAEQDITIGGHLPDRVVLYCVPVVSLGAPTNITVWLEHRDSLGVGTWGAYHHTSDAVSTVLLNSYQHRSTPSAIIAGMMPMQIPSGSACRVAYQGAGCSGAATWSITVDVLLLYDFRG